MGDKTAKTIDFLRARLLAERSVSRAARHRANELAKRVSELEKQLKFVSLQRKKAEKATADVLAILENHGRNELSEPFDSSSDKEDMSSDYKDGKHVEALEHVKVQESDTEGFSCSEVESSSVNGRSLSWKSSKNSSSRYLEKKYMDASRRRRSFTSSGSSSRHGKSCRQIRRREHRSEADGSQSDDVTNGHLEHEGRTISEGVRNSADVAIKASVERVGINEDKDSLEVPRHAIKDNGTERDMERALEHQAQFIAQYEAEEKAQREWEDKFRENNISAPDLGDAGTHSDITEERDESKVPAPTPDPSPPSSIEKLATESQEINSGVVDTKFHEEPKIDTEPPSLDQKNSAMDNNEESDNQNHPPDLQGTRRNFSPAQLSSAQDSSFLHKIEQTSGKSFEPTIETQDKLGSVLEALQQAKLSLKQNLDELPLLENGPSSIPTYRSGDKFPVPSISTAGLFRLPIDYENGGTGRANTLTYDPRLSLTNYPTEPSGGPLISSPYRERVSLSRSVSFVDDHFRMVPSFPYQETRSEIPRLPPSALDPRLGMGPSALDPRVGMGPSTLDPRMDAGMGPSTLDPRLGMRSSALDPRYGVGMSTFDPRLEKGLPFTDERYIRSNDRFDSGSGLSSSSRYGTLPATRMPLQTRSMYEGYIRPNSFE